MHRRLYDRFCIALSMLGLVACSDSGDGKTNGQIDEQEESDARVGPPAKRDASADAQGGDDDDDDDVGDDDDDDDDQSQPDAGSGPGLDSGKPPTMNRDAATDAARDAAPAAADGRVPNEGSDAASGTGTRFSFFVTSLKALRELANDQNGFGGDLRFGETGAGAGLRGADKICTTIAEKSLAGSGAKGWRAFLSATQGGANGGPAHAIDRIGKGPWYDRRGRLVAMTLADIAQIRPATADPAIKNDLPNEEGTPNHAPDGMQVDNHHVLTGSNDKGQLYANSAAATCSDWTKSQPDMADAPRVGLSWPRRGGGGANAQNWLSAMDESGCGKGVSLTEMGGPVASNPTVGSGGGYGAIYCFALSP
jgi:hypothetical protein